MSNELVIYSVSDVRVMAEAISKSGLFNLKTPEQAMALCLIAQAEGLHPARAARDYDIIQNKPVKKPEAMLRDFQANGGKVDWHELTDTKAEATFSHPQGGAIKISWDIDRAKKAALSTKDNWLKYPRPMLRSRVISEGVRSVYPGATSGSYTREEVESTDMIDVTPAIPEPKLEPQRVEVPADPETGEILPPHTLPYTTAVDFGKVIAAAIQASKTDAELTDWVGQNEENLKKLETASPKMRQRVTDLEKKQRESFAPKEEEEKVPPAIAKQVAEAKAAGKM